MPSRRVRSCRWIRGPAIGLFICYLPGRGPRTFCDLHRCRGHDVEVAASDAVVQAMCDAVDAGDAESFGSFFAVDASYRFDSGPVVSGRDAGVEATRGAIDSMPWVGHHVDQVAHFGDRLFCLFTINTANAAGAEVMMPCVTVLWLAEGEIVDYRVRMDLSPHHLGSDLLMSKSALPGCHLRDTQLPCERVIES